MLSHAHIYDALVDGMPYHIGHFSLVWILLLGNKFVKKMVIASKIYIDKSLPDKNNFLLTFSYAFPSLEQLWSYHHFPIALLSIKPIP